MKAIAAIACSHRLGGGGVSCSCSCARNETQHPFHHGRRHRLDAAEHLSRGLALGETPNIDRIGHEGAQFMTYYAEQSCTAGRTAFITGMQPVRVGMVLPEIPEARLICGLARLHSPSSYRPRLHHRRVWQEPSRRPHRVPADRERLPGILGLSVPPRCHAAGELP